jgi:hypothetical protein
MDWIDRVAVKWLKARSAGEEASRGLALDTEVAYKRRSSNAANMHTQGNSSRPPTYVQFELVNLPLATRD